MMQQLSSLRDIPLHQTYATYRLLYRLYWPLNDKGLLIMFSIPVSNSGFINVKYTLSLPHITLALCRHIFQITNLDRR